MIDSTQSSPLISSSETLSKAWTTLRTRLSDFPAHEEITNLNKAVTDMDQQVKFAERKRNEAVKNLQALPDELLKVQPNRLDHKLIGSTLFNDGELSAWEQAIQTCRRFIGSILEQLNPSPATT